MRDLQKILESTTSSSAVERNDAIKLLETSAVTNYRELIEGLVQIFINKDGDQTIKSQAGLYFKNMLTSRVPSYRSMLINKWLDLDLEFRNTIKNQILTFLGHEKTKPSVAAQLISVISFAEFSAKSWPELISVLTEKIKGQDQNAIEASIETVGYMCQDLPQTYLIPFSSDLLNNIVYCMRKEQSEAIRIVATKAMYESLEFVDKNFSVEFQRNLIMQNVCESAVSTNPKLKIAGLQCLCKIIQLYYDWMEHYMTQALFTITFEAMKSENDDISLQGIEFWSTLGEVEQEIQEHQNSMTKNYCQKALPYIVPYLLDRLCIDDDDEDSWTPHKAASVCLLLMAQSCFQEISPHLLPFIGLNFNSESPIKRDAATIALGTLIDSSDETQMETIIENGFPILIQLCKDSSARVRDTSFWALSKIYTKKPEFTHQTEKTMLSIGLISESLSDIPRVATNVCWAFTAIIRALYGDSKIRPNHMVISSNYESIINAVNFTIKRADAGDTQLRTAAFELLNTLIECHPRDVHSLVTRNLETVLKECSQLFYSNHETSPHQFNELCQFESLYLIVIQNFINVLDDYEIDLCVIPILMTLMNFCTSTKSGTVQEDVLLTIGVLVQRSNSQKITPHLPALMPIILLLFQKFEDVSICISTCSVVGDICNCVGAQIQPFSPNLISIAFKYLSDPHTDMNMQVHLLTLIGDLALALSENFRPFLFDSLEVIRRASAITSTNDDDIDFIDLVDEIKSASLDTYTSIIQGLYKQNQVPSEDSNIWRNNLPYIVSLIESISEDPNHSDSVTRSSCGLIGDMLNLFRSDLSSSLKNPSIQKLVLEATNSSAVRTKNVGFWVKNMLESV